MDTYGRHLLGEYHGCDAALLDDADRVADVLRRAAEAAGATVLQTHVRRFEPQGVTGVIMVAESHVSIHTWPEARYAAVDVFTCGDGDLQAAHDLLVRELCATRHEVLVVARGLGGEPSMRVGSL